MKRKCYEAQAVLAYMLPEETYQSAKERLDLLWAKNEHPYQVMMQRRRQPRE